MWRQKYDDFEPLELRKLNQPGEENSTHRRVVADLSLYKAMLNGCFVKKLTALKQS
jgi:putative transposase